MKWLNSRHKSIFLFLLISGAVIRVISLFFIKNWEAAIWAVVCFSWPIWVTYALFYNKDMYGPFSWNNGKNQVGRVAITIVTLWVYGLLMYKAFP